MYTHFHTYFFLNNVTKRYRNLTMQDYFKTLDSPNKINIRFEFHIILKELLILFSLLSIINLIIIIFSILSFFIKLFDAEVVVTKSTVN